MDNGNGQVHDLAVEFGGVSIGESTARLGLRIKKELLNIIAAEELLCGRRLTGAIQLGGAADNAGQGKLFDCDVAVPGTFDVHRFGVSIDHYTTGLTFKLNEIEIGDLAQFSKGSGRLRIEGVAAIPTDTVDEDEDEDETPRGLLKSEGPWREVQLDTLFAGGVLKAMKKAGLATVGDLSDWTEPNKDGYTKRLVDIPGIGEAKAQAIEDTMMTFWADNPQDGDE
ncbi:MAG TPA: hypothetical protein PKD54_07625 [Pirellulaceae bacterium]|mgnify:CR=1 FL=1|nr:hypothetical protein [Pirellulaceae bacterium]